MKHLVVFISLALTFSAGTRAALCQSSETDKITISHQLDELHKMASEANFEGYFALYHDRAVFLGTDATERWPVDEFKSYTRQRFEQGTGWTYVMTSRNIFVSSDGNTAWFDELLENENLGLTRGTGVLLKEDGKWLFSQYNLTIPVPNDLARDLVSRIRAIEETG